MPSSNEHKRDGSHQHDGSRDEGDNPVAYRAAARGTPAAEALTQHDRGRLLWTLYGSGMSVADDGNCSAPEHSDAAGTLAGPVSHHARNATRGYEYRQYTQYLRPGGRSRKAGSVRVDPCSPIPRRSRRTRGVRSAPKTAGPRDVSRAGSSTACRLRVRADEHLAERDGKNQPRPTHVLRVLSARPPVRALAIAQRSGPPI